MAVDWWLLRNLETPIVRFYRWDRPAVSLGYRQQSNPPDFLREQFDDFFFVVRPSGGGFLYHHGDLSFSFFLPEGTPVTRMGIKESYGRLSVPLVEAVRSLKLIDSIEWGNGNASSEECVASPAEHEPTVRGSKWMAAAQARVNGDLLQQGTLFWIQDWPGSLGETFPAFLGPSSGRVSLRELRNEIIRTVQSHLFRDRKARMFSIDTTDWQIIDRIRDSFHVESLSDLPVFDRHQPVLPP